MDEGGMFVRLADRLAAEGFTVLRFSFRGRGKSAGSPRGVTIAGELLDPWGLRNFGPQQQEELHRAGFLLIDYTFQLGRVMFEELNATTRGRASWKATSQRS